MKKIYAFLYAFLIALLLTSCSSIHSEEIRGMKWHFDDKNTFYTERLVVSATNMYQNKPLLFISKSFDLPFAVSKNKRNNNSKPKFENLDVLYSSLREPLSPLNGNEIIIPSYLVIGSKKYHFNDGTSYHDTLYSLLQMYDEAEAELIIINRILNEGLTLNLIADAFNYCNVVGIYLYNFVSRESKIGSTAYMKINEYDIHPIIYCSSTLYERLISIRQRFDK